MSVTERVCIVPRWAGGADSDWYPWIRAELAREYGSAVQVDVLELPNPKEPLIEQCVAALVTELGDDPRALSETLLVGHSVGCQALMRYLASLAPTGDEPEGVEQLVCVAGWWTVDEPWPSIRPWIDTRIDLPRLRATAGRVSVLLSDNDPFTADWRANKTAWELRLDASVRVAPGGKHFNRSEEPAVLELLRELIQPR